MRLVSAEEATSGVRSGQRVYLHCAAATPSVLLDSAGRPGAGAARRQRHPPPHRGPGATPRARDGRALPASRAVHRPERPSRGERGPGRLRPGLPVRRARGCSRAARCRSTSVFVNATPPDAHGFCSLGTSVEAMHAAIRAAKTVIVQLNRSMPRTLGDSFIHVDDIDLGVEVDVPPYAHAEPDRSATSSERIGEHVADLVPIGPRSSSASARSRRRRRWRCTDKHDLGIHTEMFTDAVVDLVEAGVVTGAAQGAQPRQDRDHVPDGLAPAVRTSSTTTRWSRCGRSTSPTTPTSSARSAGWSRSTRRSRST